MTFDLEASCKITLEYHIGNKGSKHLETKFILNIPPPLEHKRYHDSDGLPNKDGTNAVTEIFVQGLVANIHQAHDRGYFDSAEHLRSIIGKLEMGFVRLSNTLAGEYETTISKEINTENTCEWNLPSSKVVTDRIKGESLDSFAHRHALSQRIHVESALVEALDLLNNMPKNDKVEAFLNKFK